MFFTFELENILIIFYYSIINLILILYILIKFTEELQIKISLLIQVNWTGACGC